MYPPCFVFCPASLLHDSYIVHYAPVRARSRTGVLYDPGFAIWVHYFLWGALIPTRGIRRATGSQKTRMSIARAYSTLHRAVLLPETVHGTGCPAYRPLTKRYARSKFCR